MAEQTLSTVDPNKISSTFGMAIAVMVLLVMILLPLPKILLDLLVIVNISLSVLTILVTMYTQEPLQFSVFPSYLLVITVFRLALGVALSRAILLNADAGGLVTAFGAVVVGGNYVVGVVIFLVLIIVQFVVITGGAQRVAEVAARFTLDAMPGKQMAIDADLNAGLLTEVQAREKRQAVAHEADFYGSMDGATKFIRGDAISSIIITIVNILGGFIIGVAQQGMTLLQALQTYTLLTVGSGIALQVPALLISSATGIIVTRSTSESSLGSEIAKQLFVNFKAVYSVAAFSGLLLLVPGVPKTPMIMITALFIYLGYIKSVAERTAATKKVQAEAAQKESEKGTPAAPEKIVPTIHFDAMEIEIGYGLIPVVDPKQGGDLLESITNLRKKIASEMGIVVPPIRIRDNMSLKPNTYIVKIRGSEVARSEIMVGRFLAMDPGNVTERISGFETREPTFGLPALWISPSDKERASVAGYTVVDPTSVIITHLTEIIYTHAHELLGRQEVKLLIDNVKEKYPAVVEDVIPAILSLAMIQKTLQNLLKERVPIRNLVTILECLADHGQTTKDLDSLTGYVRQKLSRLITKMYQTPKGIVAAVTLDPALEQKIADSLQYTDQGAYTSLSPVYIQKMFVGLAEEIEKMSNLGYQPIVLCSSSVRPHFKRLTERSFSTLVVLAYNEILPDVEIQAIGMVKLPNEN